MENPKFKNDDGCNVEINDQDREYHVGYYSVNLIYKCPHTFLDCISKKLYILHWLPEYSMGNFFGDLLAGLTIGLTVIPQSMGLAGIAGVPAQFGLYSSFISPIVYAFMGTSKSVPMGPSAIVALLTYNTIQDQGPTYATFLCFITGIIQILMHFTGMAMLMNFISVPVTTGFTTAVGILIICSQIKDLTGIKVRGATLIQMVQSLTKDIKNVNVENYTDTVIGVSCILTLQVLKMLSNIHVGIKNQEQKMSKHNILIKILWMIGAFRNLFVVIVCCFISYYYINYSNHTVKASSSRPISFKIIGKIPSGLPQLKWPEFNINVDRKEEGFIKIVTNMGFGIIVVPLISMLESISLSRKFADGNAVNTSQEFLAIGLSNIGSSFVQGFPGSGALARGALNYSSGVKTPLGGLYTGITVMVALIFLTPYFYYIPKASLASVIIAASFSMIEIEPIKIIYYSKKKDLIFVFVTFFACLVFPLEIGVLFGIFLNIGFILSSAAKPKISIEIQKTSNDVKYLLLTPDRYLIFPSTENVRKLITEYDNSGELSIVIDGSRIFEADFTTANVFSTISHDLSRKGQKMYMFNLKPSVIRVFDGINDSHIIFCSNKQELEEIIDSNENNEEFPLLEKHKKYKLFLTKVLRYIMAPICRFHLAAADLQKVRMVV
ncbi:sodium-independent sulfate anion transporter-like isoform X3 [Daktulosphaira vitifoliae]|uniref:sodium-independent sulfate anion transporter-like isoform X3 n=1 Tax=Daktulosphaira vitifoliae TaxID=58002 RepID=UPI0021AA75C6|nr:sodium-independent sulfate anion transporter-like isoform X3 [Daktulosphaira vitifoliae]